MNDSDRKKIEERLLEERESRLESLAELDEGSMDPFLEGELSKYPLHMADHGTETMQQEKEFLLAHAEGQQLLEIDESLRRLYREPEAFGTCERCGGEIGMERLDLVPWAKLCIDCQREVEAGDSAEAGGSAEAASP